MNRMTGNFLRAAAISAAALLCAAGAFAQNGEKRAAARTIVVYFSWGGNTRGIAQKIQQKLGCDIFEIVPEKAYSSDYNTVLDEAQRDQRAQARPKIKGPLPDLKKYDTVILGYPNWWASIPMPIATFLESGGFDGKAVVPFCSHGGGRLGQSVSAITKLVPGATVLKALPVHYSGGSSVDADISKWLSQNGF